MERGLPSPSQASPTTARQVRTKPGDETPTDSPAKLRSTSMGGGRRVSQREEPKRNDKEKKAKAEEGGRQMFDKNTLRLMHREIFTGAIGRYQQRMLQSLDKNEALTARTPRRRPRAVQVFVRVRPIFDKDIEKGDFDVVSVVPGQLVLHSCLFEADLKSPFISHLSFSFDQVFGHTASNKRLLELRGDKCFDLLAATCKGRDFPELRLREHGNGTYRAEGAMELYPQDAEDMRVVLETGHARRKTSATGANAVSSRSHAVCIIRLFERNGMLVLVDCAGSERKKDSMYHTKERQQESAEINTSLSSLKDCIRSLCSQQKVPSHVYRTSSLTKILADAFISEKGRLAVICTASPCATDTEHTVSTLRLGAALAGFNDSEEKEPLVDLLREQRGQPEAHPNQWNPEQVRAWIADVQNGDFGDVLGSLPSNTTGQMLVRFTEARCAQLCLSAGMLSRTLGHLDNYRL
ncbi:unnamed protein product [Effrenium voratum]|nr:unnamed protein product [Effrenium voratum]